MAVRLSVVLTSSLLPPTSARLILMASSSDAELTLPDGFPLAPKGCEKPSQRFFDCFTAAGVQKDGVAVRSQRPRCVHASRFIARRRTRPPARAASRSARRRSPRTASAWRGTNENGRSRPRTACPRRTGPAATRTACTSDDHDDDDGGREYNVVCECSVRGATQHQR